MVTALRELGAPRFQHLSLALLAFAQLMYSLDINIVFVSLPEIGSGLGFSEHTLQWVVSAYTVCCGGFLLFGGRAADLLGQRRVFIGALWLYALSSLAGGLAWSPVVIVIARAIQGIGAALLFPATLSLINRLFEEGPSRNRALAVWGGAGASGLTLGSLAGGVLTSACGWPSVFFVNVLLAAIAICAAFFVLPKDHIKKERRNFDLPGAVTVTTGAILLVYVLVQGPEDGWLSEHILLSLSLAVVFLLAFTAIEFRSPDPLMPVRLFRNRSLVTGMVITFIYMGTFGALPYFLTLMFQSMMKYSALETGLAFIVPSLAIFAGTQFGARLANRLSLRTVLLAGFLTGVAGTLALVPSVYSGASYVAVLPGLVISGIGQGIVWTAMWVATGSGVKPGEQGIASGMASTTLNVGNAIGIALLVALSGSGTISLQQVNPEKSLENALQLAFYLAAGGQMAGLFVSYLLPHKAATDLSAEMT
ncbi:MFS transporter [Candidatus Pantoea multigeneris]|uniref:MFS transporter n=1 Tax=Candidatus Pantoea multigeneris TaxID=2608357 RepID=A0ABX0R9C7_9GAMM|nr:MFS transporter [Pantoea multigeneris]NIF21980.1 MFS transporter [Pantoea multigeneris]